MANKLTTLGYILKRLRDSGYKATKVFTDYGEQDARVWTIVIQPGTYSVFCTCFVNDPYFGETFFELYDGNQFIPTKLKIKTSSFEVLVEHLARFSINGY